jgi:ABC-type multidrug transport system ATPase subunit
MNADARAAADAPIAVEGLTVRYGSTLAVDGVSLAVPPGAVFALLGRNGAGKSSLVRCLLGQQRSTAGRALLFGDDAWRGRARAMARVGVVPEVPDAPPAMPVGKIAAFCARLYPRWDAEAVAARLRRFEIPQDRPFGRLSKGQKGLVSLALALGHEPEALVLDDPTLGLDVAARRALFEELVGELADRGTTVLLTTHDLAGIEGIADRVAILHAGRLVVDEPMETLKERHAASSSALEDIFLAETAAAAAGGAR